MYPNLQLARLPNINFFKKIIIVEKRYMKGVGRKVCLLAASLLFVVLGGSVAVVMEKKLT